jgi:hypothetical protein
MTGAGSTAERGYTGEHVKLKERWRPVVEAGNADCAEIICLYRSRWIPPGAKWDLAHDRSTGGYRGPAHRKCNRSEGARWGNQARGRRRHRLQQQPARQPRHW